MKNQNYELPIWRDGENLRGGINAVIAITKLSKETDLKYDRIVGLALLIQSALLNIKKNEESLYRHVTHGNTKLSEIVISDTGNEKIVANSLDSKTSTFKITLNPKKILTLFAKDIHLNPETKEEVVRYFIIQEMAKIRQEQKVPSLHTAKQLSTHVLREADSTAIALTSLSTSYSPRSLNFLQNHYLIGIKNLPDMPNNRDKTIKFSRDIATKVLLAIEKQNRNQGQSWTGYLPSAIKSTQYPDIYQTAANRLALMARERSR